MPNPISPALMQQFLKRSSEDPFLTLITFTSTSFTTIRLVNNTEDIISRGNTFKAFPIKVTLPVDDGETAREVSLTMDNVSLDIIGQLRSVTEPIEVKLELILASIPDEVQMSFEELKIGSVDYNPQTITARLFMDDFLSVALTSEKYGPTQFPGLF